MGKQLDEIEVVAIKEPRGTATRRCGKPAGPSVCILPAGHLRKRCVYGQAEGESAVSYYEGSIRPRVAVAVVAGAATMATVVLLSMAIGQATMSMGERFMWWAVLTGAVALGLSIFGAVTWGNDEEGEE